MSHTLRLFRKEDEGGSRELILGILAKEYPFAKDAYSDTDLYKIGETYGSPRNAFFVIEEDNNIVGTVGIKEDSKTEALLRRFFVNAKYRGKGYGSELLAQALKFCKENGYKKIFFRCTDRMADAIRLCAKNGFKETESLEVGGFHIHKMELSL